MRNVPTGRESGIKNDGMWGGIFFAMCHGESPKQWSLQKTLINLSAVISATKFSHVRMKYAYKTRVFDSANLKEVAGPQK